MGIKLNKKASIIFSVIVVTVAVGLYFNYKFSIDLFLIKYIDRALHPNREFASYLDQAKLNNKINKNFNAAPNWMQTQINQDLSNFDKKYTLENLLALQKKYHKEQSFFNLCLLGIKNGEVYSVRLSEYSGMIDKACYTIEALLEYLAENKIIDNVAILLCPEDYFKANAFLNEPDFPFPVFVFARDNANLEKNTILIPDWMNLRRWQSLSKRIELTNNYYKWEHKKPVVFWRGGNSDPSNLRHLLVDFSSNQNLNYLDAKFPKDDLGKKINPRVDPEYHLPYKYQVSIDGVRATWERLVWQLASNCVVLKQNSSHKQWFYNAIEPYVHYYPVDPTPESVIAAYHALEQNPELALRITQNGQQFARDNLSLEDMVAYFVFLLREYKAKVFEA